MNPPTSPQDGPIIGSTASRLKLRLARWRLPILLFLLISAAGYKIVFTFYDPSLSSISKIRPWPRSTVAERTPDRLRVLFIGNSLTYYNGGIPYILSQLAASAGKSPVPVFDQSIVLGATLMEIWDIGKAQRVIAEGNWDFVVLQDHTESTIQWRGGMSRYARQFSALIRNARAEPVFFMTWARADEPASIAIISKAYSEVAAENHGLLVPVGIGWQNALREKPKLKLHNSTDYKHPTAAGSYLTACMFYSAFFHQSPSGLTRTISEQGKDYIDLKEADATFLQNIAWQTINREGAIATTQPIN